MTTTNPTDAQMITRNDAKAADDACSKAELIGGYDIGIFTKAFARHRLQAVEEERERCAALADDHSFALDIDEWMKMTKKEISAYACRSVAAAIRRQNHG